MPTNRKTFAAYELSHILRTLLLCIASLWAMSTSARAQLYVSQLSNTLGEYDPLTGAGINPNLITTGLNEPYGIAVSGNTLFVANYTEPGTVGEYDATSGAVINANYITGLSSPPRRNRGIRQYSVRSTPEHSRRRG
jgi:hypothetical protein